MAFRVLLCFLAVAQSALAVNTLLYGSDRNITEWFWQTAIAVGNYLYVTGGEYYNISGNYVNFQNVTSTMVIDLTKSWTNATVTATTFQDDPQQFVRRPMMWYDGVGKKIYKYGGWPYNPSGNTYSQNLYSLPVDGNGKATSSGWTSNTATGANGLGSTARAPAGAGFTYTNTSFYSLGGESPDSWTPQAGLVQYNNSAGTWTNQSSVGATSTGYWSNAAAAWASKFGPKGYLVLVGGAATEYDPGVTSRSQLFDMSTITLYDINSGSWYQQPATGDIPPPRNAFCYTSAATSGTFELFIYGGSTDAGSADNSDPNDTGYLNVYVLSLPAFRWFKSSDSTSVRRANNYCTTIGNRQMISIGGSQPSDSGGTSGGTTGILGAAPDPWPNGIGIFDMTAFQWVSSYNPNAALYESPNVVKSYYSSSPTSVNFVNPTLAAAFGAATSQNTSPTTTSGGVSGTGSSSAGGGSSTNGSKTNVGAIAGGVIGGVAALILIAVAIFFLRRRSKRRQTAIPTQQSDPRWMQGQGQDLGQGNHAQNGYTAYQERKPYDSAYSAGGTYSSQAPSSYQTAPSEMANTQPPVEMSADPLHRNSSRFREMPG